MRTDSFDINDRIKQAFALARDEKPAYGELYPLLEGLFLVQAEIKKSIDPDPPDITSQLAQTKWEGGFPLIRRWEFPLDIRVAESILARVSDYIPLENRQMSAAHSALTRFLAGHSDEKEAFWQSFLQHEGKPWDEWLDTEEVDLASVLFLARSCLRPSLESVAEGLLERFPPPESWLKGYCPVCGSLPALLFLKGEGERRAHCSWCSTEWGLHRLQCPHCDNRYHESLGYIYIEAEPHYRVQYCRLCKAYFKLIDTRERLYPPYLPLEEWTTLHLDLLAQQAGWKQPPSPSPVVYGESNS